MTANRTNRYLVALSISAALFLAQRAQADSFVITVNTTSLQGTSGYLDFQFNPGNTPYDAASATITGLTTDGTLTTVLPNIGDVSGALPGQVVINNTDVLNEYTQGITYGSFFDVFVDLTIPTVSGTATGGSSFTLDVEDSNFNSLLGSFPAVEIDLDATTGQPSITNNSDGAASVVITPEPDSLWLVGLGFAGLAAARRRQLASKVQYDLRISEIRSWSVSARAATIPTTGAQTLLNELAHINAFASEAYRRQSVDKGLVGLRQGRRKCAPSALCL